VQWPLFGCFLKDNSTERMIGKTTHGPTVEN
jgi:hypothetical protein